MPLEPNILAYFFNLQGVGALRHKDMEVYKFTLRPPYPQTKYPSSRFKKFGFYALEDGIDRLPRSDGSELPVSTA